MVLNRRRRHILLTLAGTVNLKASNGEGYADMGLYRMPYDEELYLEARGGSLGIEKSKVCLCSSSIAVSTVAFAASLILFSGRQK